MDERRIALYNYLISRGDRYTPQAEISRELYYEYGNAECCLEPKDYHDTTERRYLSDDIRSINASPEFEKIIISSCKGVKIANEEEFTRYILNQYKSTISKLSRIYKMAKKGNKNGQIDFGGHTIEAFLENLN